MNRRIGSAGSRIVVERPFEIKINTIELELCESAVENAVLPWLSRSKIRHLIKKNNALDKGNPARKQKSDYGRYAEIFGIFAGATAFAFCERRRGSTSGVISIPIKFPALLLTRGEIGHPWHMLDESRKVSKDRGKERRESTARTIPFRNFARSTPANRPSVANFSNDRYCIIGYW